MKIFPDKLLIAPTRPIGHSVNRNVVIRISTQYFYELGTVLHPLGELKGETDGMQFAYIFYMADTRLANLLEQTLIPVKICRSDAQKLKGVINSISERVFKTGASDEEKKIQSWETFQLSDALKRFEAVLAAELSQMDTYFVSQKGCYSTIHLIDQAELIFPESIRNLLPPDAIIDIRQGGRCLAFELPTAAGFHFLRATEAVLHKYFDVISGGKNRPRTRNMAKYLESLHRFRADPKVLAVLQQIKDLHRNPIAHPEAVLSMEEAIALIGIMQSAISTMITIVKNHPGKPSTPATPGPVLMPPSTPVAFATPEKITEKSAEQT